jgi:type IV fimbrial biogenesis protein FimT
MPATRGFTLVELLTVVAAAAVLSVTVTALGSLVRATRVTAAANELLAGLLLTRSEATKRRLRVVMCRSADGRRCAGSGGWQQGWIVFVDADGDGERAAGEMLLQAQPALAGSLRLTGTATVARYVSYAPNGATRLVGGGFQAGTLTVCSQSSSAATGRQIVINAHGRPRTQAVRLASCA